ncbi:dynein heavy chain 6 [Lasius niger]|uniref:Dynein heavy chain 6 n=1 Tax=Lasius niger TaxID=67767 RepID=A0A0J7K4A8_LASNI|nr:dynein heavy chain 6 [Lasius niger]
MLIGRNLVLSPTFGWNLRFTFSLSSSPTSRKVFQSTRKYRPLLRLVGKTGSGARVVPPKDSSSATRFALDDVGVNVSREAELFLAESGVIGVVSVVTVVEIVEETSADSANKIRDKV